MLQAQRAHRTARPAWRRRSSDHPSVALRETSDTRSRTLLLGGKAPGPLPSCGEMMRRVLAVTRASPAKRGACFGPLDSHPGPWVPPRPRSRSHPPLPPGPPAKDAPPWALLFLRHVLHEHRPALLPPVARLRNGQGRSSGTPAHACAAQVARRGESGNAPVGKRWARLTPTGGGPRRGGPSPPSAPRGAGVGQR